MQEQTKNKLDILVKAGKINFEDLEFLKELDRDLSKQDNGDKEEMLLIHVAMSLSRQRDNNTVFKMPDELWKQVTNKQAYRQAKEYWIEKESKAPILLSYNENQYIIMHLVNVFTKKQS